MSVLRCAWIWQGFCRGAELGWAGNKALLQEQNQTVQSLLVFKEMTEDAGIRAAVICRCHVSKGRGCWSVLAMTLFPQSRFTLKYDIIVVDGTAAISLITTSTSICVTCTGTKGFRDFRQSGKYVAVSCTYGIFFSILLILHLVFSYLSTCCCLFLEIFYLLRVSIDTRNMCCSTFHFFSLNTIKVMAW